MARLTHVDVFSVLAFNLMRGLQVTLVPCAVVTWKRRWLMALKSIRTLRFQWLNRAGLLVYPRGRATLDVGSADPLRQHFQHIQHALIKAA